jgi:hypothetical protein
MVEEVEFDQIRERIIGVAIEVCRTLGPGSLQSMSRSFSRISYLKLAGCPVGLLINFNVRQLTHGIKRLRI